MTTPARTTRRDLPAAPSVDRYADLYAGFRWQVPASFNIAEACCARWARRTPDAVAVIIDREDGSVETCRFAELQAQANRLSHVLAGRGVQRGDRVAIVMPQRVETAVAHLAVYQLGAVAMPLSMLFGPDALEYRLNDSEARLAIADESSIANVLAARAACPALATVLAVGRAEGRGDLAWGAAMARERSRFTAARTHSDEAAVLVYTSGTTGPPKGALMPHRALIGNLSGFVCSQNWFPDARPERPDAADPFSPGTPSPSSRGMPNPTRHLSLGNGEQGKGEVRTGRGPVSWGQSTQSVFWSPADWAWTGGLMDALLPTLYFGRPIVASRARFAPVKAFELMQRHRVTHAFLFPTALKAMMKTVPAPRDIYDLMLRAVMSAGEAVGDAVFTYCRDRLGVTVNEMFGQTEVNYIVGNCGHFVATDGHAYPAWPARPGSMGRPYPGHRVAVLDDAGNECPRGTPGDVAVHRLDVHGMPDPVFFLGYWRNDAATRAKFTGDVASSWCRTGDTAVMDADGYLWYQGRSDDVFKAAGYRIGPSEIENCLVKHAAVANAAVVPRPDAERGAVVKAYVVLAPGHVGDAALVQALQDHVRERLAPYEYPKEIEFIAELPMTTTGKVQRRVLRLREEERAAARAAQAGSQPLSTSGPPTGP
jgi:acetyl-CoA synthetase